jgi:hypothetical protein
MEWLLKPETVLTPSDFPKKVKYYYKGEKTMPERQIMSDKELNSKAIPLLLQNDLGIVHCSTQSANTYQRIKRFVGLRNGLIQEVSKVPEQNIQTMAVYQHRINEYEDSILDLASRVGANHE